MTVLRKPSLRHRLSTLAAMLLVGVLLAAGTTSAQAAPAPHAKTAAIPQKTTGCVKAAKGRAASDPITRHTIDGVPFCIAPPACTVFNCAARDTWVRMWHVMNINPSVTQVRQQYWAVYGGLADTPGVRQVITNGSTDIKASNLNEWKSYLLWEATAMAATDQNLQSLAVMVAVIPTARGPLNYKLMDKSIKNMIKSPQVAAGWGKQIKAETAKYNVGIMSNSY